MFLEHTNVVWGTHCPCGQEVFSLQEKLHPWDEGDAFLTLPCPACKTLVRVSQPLAKDYYNQRIYSLFADVKGVVLDLGCGGGFISQFLLSLPQVSRVIALDSDPGCREALTPLAVHGRLEFILADVADLGVALAGTQVDYAVSRDLFMFVEDVPEFLAQLSRLTRSGLRQMAWYAPQVPRMKNKVHPHQLPGILANLGWQATVTGLNWYKYGYFLKADK